MTEKPGQMAGLLLFLLYINKKPASAGFLSKFQGLVLGVFLTLPVLFVPFFFI